MGKITSFFQSLKSKIKEMTLMRKVAVGVLTAIVLITLVVLIVNLTKTKYKMLYTALESEDAKIVQDYLKEQGIKYKVEGDTIHVPEKLRDGLQIELNPQIESGLMGLKGIAESSMLGESEAQFNVKNQDAIREEIVKFLQGYPQIDEASAMLVLEEKSAFVKDTDPASVSARVTTNQELTNEQVKTLVMSITKMVGNLPKENVTISDQTMRELTDGIFDEEENASKTAEFDEQMKAKREFEADSNEKLKTHLEKIFGKDRVAVTTNAELNHDKVVEEKIETEKDPAKLSDQEKESTTTENGGNVTSSPVDDNINNEIVEGEESDIVTENRESINNYREDGKTTTQTERAMGRLDRITVTVSIDKADMTAADRQTVNDVVRNALGIINEDDITVFDTEFDPDSKQLAEEELEASRVAEIQEKLNQLSIMLAIGVGSLITVVILLIIMRGKRKAEKLAAEFEEEAVDEGLNVIIADDVENENYKTIDFDEKSEEAIVEDQIKKYAEEKPEQVAEIVKSWLVGDEGGV